MPQPLLLPNYRIISGKVIVVPNLNFSSIIMRSRGIHGDMNRKFDQLNSKDPESRTIDRIKTIMLDPDVDFILNLHDGSGFYSPVYEERLRCPDRWGQSIIIDQEKMALLPQNRQGLFTDLARAAAQCAQDVNRTLLDPSHRVHVKNTRTAKGNREMAKTLTFFALKHQKPAFGIEASKSFLTPTRVYYHLAAIESFFTQAGIEFERRFVLDKAGIKRAMDQDIALSMGDRRILLFAENIRRTINYIPMKKTDNIKFQVNHPLLTLVPSGKGYNLFHGNRRLTRLSFQYFDCDLGLDRIEMVVDGRPRLISFGSIVPVKDRFLVKPIPDHRVNVIGFTRKNTANESGLVIERPNFAKRFSIDWDGRIFRIEVYRQGKFTGMVLVDFRTRPSALKLARSDENSVYLDQRF
ncbi:MAG: deacylase [Desulfobacter sp.]|nr:deacylase [Desulfobacter sp.]WDP85898.1 MAG: deacylase [Desulfobacter sp.]